MKRHKSVKSLLKSEQGFAIPTVLGFGLIMLLVGMTMVLRSQDDRTTAAAQRGNAQSLAVTEGGVARSLSKLNVSSYRALLLLSYDPSGLLGSSINQWSSWTGTPPPNTCSNGASASVTAADITSAITVGQTSNGGGTANLLAYRYNNPNGSSNQDGDEYATLLMEGATSGNFASRSRLQVNLPINLINLPAPTLASIMAKKIDLQKHDVTGNITCLDPSQCNVSCANTSTGPSTSELETAIGADPLAELYGPYDPSSPPSPLPSPTITVSASSMPAIPSAPSGATTYNLGAVTSNITLPRSGDVSFTSNGVTAFYYQITNIDKSTIQVTPGNNVRLYVSGFIDQTGNNDIRPTTGVPTPAGQIRLYGGFTNGTLPSSTQTFSFGGNSCTMAFIHAPKADVGIVGGGNGCSTLPGGAQGTNIYGAVWVNKIQGNPSNSGAYFEQPGLMTTLSGENPNAGQAPIPAVPTSWQRVGVN